MGRLPVPVLFVALVIGCGGHGSATVASDGPVSGDGAYQDGTAIDHTIRVTLNDRPDHPDAFAFMVAFRDGDGPWQPAGTSNGDTYSFVALSPAWSVAWTCNGYDSTDSTTLPSQHLWVQTVTIAEFTVAERTNLTMDVPNRCSDRLPAVLAMSGTISNAPVGTGALYVNLLDQRAGAGDTYSLRARLGVHDLLVRKIDQRNDSVATFSTVDAFVERNLSVASSQHDLDLATAAPTRAFDVVGAQNTKALATTLFYTKSGTLVTLGRTAPPLLQTFALDASQVTTTDVYDQQVELDGENQTAIMTTATQTPGPLTVQPPAPLGSATTAVVAETPYPTLQTTWPAYAGADGYTWVATQPSESPDDCQARCPVLAWTALVSPGVAGGSPMYRMPDLSGLPGWNPVFGFQNGLPIAGYAEADTSSGGASDFPSVTPPVPGIQRTFVRSGFTLLP